jgi:LysM repeat protein
VDTLKSLAVISLLGAVLYGVYVVASKPDKPLSPDLEAIAQGTDGPEIDDGGSSLSPPDIAGGDSQHDHAPPPAKPRLGNSWPGSKAKTETSDTSAPPLDPYVARSSANESLGKPEESPVKPAPYVGPEMDPEPNSQPEGNYPDQDDERPGVSVGSTRPSSIDEEEIEASRQRVHLWAFHQAWKTAREQVGQGRHREALLALTPFYRDPAIPADEQEELIGWLDALAAKVVYSTEHLLEPAHVVRRGQTLYTVADQYRVPYLLLKNINAVRDNDVLLPGQNLKVVRGPFRAEVDLARHEITVFVQNLYAGRFPFTLGNDPVQPGEYLVRAKDPAKEFAGPQGVLPAKDPRNPYGGIYIDLGNGISFHGCPGDAYEDQRFGCIQLAPRDAEDLFDILSKDESTVVIKE